MMLYVLGVRTQPGVGHGSVHWRKPVQYSRQPGECIRSQRNRVPLCTSWRRSVFTSDVQDFSL